jgi:hypothetical protein
MRLSTLLLVSFVSVTACGGGGSDTGNEVTAPVTPPPTPVGPAATISASGDLRFTAIGDSARLVISVFDKSGRVIPGASVIVIPSSLNVVALGSNGWVRATGSGLAVLGLVSGDARGTASAVVNQTPIRIQVSQDTLRIGTLGRNETVRATLFDRNGFPLPEFDPIFSWTSSNTQIATVRPLTSNGPSAFVSGLANGTTTVQVTSGQLAARIATIVAQVANSLFATPFSATLGVGQSQQFVIRANDSFGNQIVRPTLLWTSLNPDRVRVDSTGLATALSVGTGTILVRSGNASTSISISVR